MGNNYNKYFKTKDINENTNDKNISRTSHEITQKNQVEPQKKIEQNNQVELKNQPEPQTETQPSNEAKAAVVSTYKLNVREEPNKLSKILYVLDPRTNIIVDNIQGEWAHIYTEHGIGGYVMKEYIIISQL